ncbi:Cytochrome P450 [Macleaya cordata]|uniref:Cytochrome P450 n=1 Tax=Macleaya cordata TaxID=56857 RepID=A0A200RA31_MACCD|nr:Cytochrome P450 [Macleaya cordata]
MNMLWGGTLQGEERSRVGAEFRHVIGELVELIGKPNVSDLFPALRWFDIQGIERQTKKIFTWLDRIFNSVIEQRMKMDEENQARTCKNKESSSKDFLQFLLELIKQGDAKTQITMTQLKALLMDTVVAGTDTTSTSIEWVMTEMMAHPEIMRKVQEELEEVVGMNKMVEESHLPKLHYLDAVVKETLRLHPPGPLLLPHSPSSTCTVGGYTVPKGAIVFFNAWAMHRAPEEWDDPLDFRPERFLIISHDLKKYDYKGNNFNYLPFGSGRRICAGVNLAERMLTYVLASFLHSFEWGLPEGTKLDLMEKYGFSLKKATPLVAIPTPRLLNLELYN